MAKTTSKADFGKGIRALLGNPVQLEQAVKENPQEVVTALSGSVADVSISQIEVNPFQPRTEFEQAALDELAASIRVHGLIQPVTLRRMSENSYQLISGERRFRASQLAGLTEIPAYIRIADDQQMLEMALIENIQREDLNAVEVAISYQRLIEECSLTHETLSERVGKQRSTITNYLRLLKLPPDILGAIKAKKLSMGHARSLAGVDDIAFKLMVFRQILEQDLSVRATEEMIANYQSEKSQKKTPKPDTRLPENLRIIQDQFSSFFGTKVVMKRDNSGKGTFTIKFKNDGDLNKLLDVITSDN
jgi:ParB family transcriptional regulator, chromosome partitioning protein